MRPTAAYAQWEAEMSGGPREAEALSLVCFAINRFGRGAHPVAEPDNVGLFNRSYVCGCLRRLIASDRVTCAARSLARQAIGEDGR
jgi:hypothetical protein